ncbi:hypothetical protein V2I01_36545 [Micromonospora sp. BRA006-A]|nr:hypothetical protein [Micromonospora sp. BRA006-A]
MAREPNQAYRPAAATPSGWKPSGSAMTVGRRSWAAAAGPARRW